MNVVILVGRLTKDPNVTHGKTRNGEDITFARFSIAVDRRQGKDAEGPQADFPSCVVFGKSAEAIERYVVKGTKLAIRGRIQTGSYKNKEGSTVYTTDVAVDEWEFAESKAAAQNSQATQQGVSAPAATAPTQEVDKNGFINIPDSLDEELPFN